MNFMVVQDEYTSHQNVMLKDILQVEGRRCDAKPVQKAEGDRDKRSPGRQVGTRPGDLAEVPKVDAAFPSQGPHKLHAYQPGIFV